MLTSDLSSQLRLQALDLGEQALAQHLLLLLGGGGCQHGGGQVAALLAGHHGRGRALLGGGRGLLRWRWRGRLVAHRAVLRAIVANMGPSRAAAALHGTTSASTLQFGPFVRTLMTWRKRSNL